MSEFKGIPVEIEQRPTRSGDKYVTPQGFTAIKDGIKQTSAAQAAVLRKPSWLRAPLASGEEFSAVKRVVREHRLSTVCEEAKCPNIGECWNAGTATIMLMGAVCTRACRFCAVDTGNPRGWLDADEPENVARSVELMGLKYVVLTSVNRDDLSDGGAAHYAAAIRAIKRRTPKTAVEALMSWRLDPYDRSAIAGHGLCLLFSGKTREAAEFLSREIADRDLLPRLHHNLGQAYARLGQLTQGAEAQQHYARALAEAQRVEQIEQRSPNYKSHLSAQIYAITWAVQEKPQEADPYLRHLESMVVQDNLSPGFLAMIYSPLGRIEDALSAVERAIALHDRFIYYLRTNVFLENLRGESRFDDLLHTLHLK